MSRWAWLPLLRNAQCQWRLSQSPNVDTVFSKQCFCCVRSRSVEIFGVQVSRSVAVSSADGVAQLLGLREIGVPGKGHDRVSWAEIVHSFLFAGFVQCCRVVRGVGRSLGPASEDDVGDARAAMERERGADVSAINASCAWLVRSDLLSIASYFRVFSVGRCVGESDCVCGRA
jgi:hypothetical protein